LNNSWNNQGDEEVQNDTLNELRRILEKREAQLVEEFFKFGPEYLKEKIEKQGSDFHAVYRSLIKRRDIIKKLTLVYRDYFSAIFVEKGPMAIRSFLKIEDAEFDSVFEEIFDLIAVANGALYEYVKKHEENLAERVKRKGAIGIRMELFLNKAKYDGVWLEVMDRLLSKVCAGLRNERQIEDGLMSFSIVMNRLREHRSLRSYNKMWEYTTVE